MARDAASMESLALAFPEMSPKFALDPILQSGLGADPLLVSNSNSLALSAKRLDKSAQIIWIPRSGKTFNSATRTQQSLMQFLGNDHDTAIFFHPKTDIINGLADSFEFCNIAKPDFTPHGITDCVRQVKDGFSHNILVVSQRYHGCIWALNQRIQCLGVSGDINSKIYQMYSLLGHPEFCIKIG
jgi:hypothetical protein